MFELLDDPAYRHVLLNHLPTIGLALSWCALVAALALRDRVAMQIGLLMIALTAGSSIPVGMAGDDAYPAIFDELNGTGRDWLDYHAYLGDTWLPVIYFNAVAALIAFIAGTARNHLLLASSAGIVLITIGGLAAGVVIGGAGGKIKHEEFRLYDPPDYEASDKVR